MYARDFSVTPLKKIRDVAMELTRHRDTCFTSILPRRILCVAPWVKLINALGIRWISGALRRAKRKGLKLGRMDRQGLCTARSCWNVESYYVVPQVQRQIPFPVRPKKTWRGMMPYRHLGGAIGRGMRDSTPSVVPSPSRRRTRSRRLRPDCSRRTHTSPAEPYRQILTFWDCHTTGQTEDTFRPALLGGTGIGSRTLP
jgi:hypothetical protein